MLCNNGVRILGGGGDERENLHDNGPIPAFASREFSQHKNQQFHFAAAEAAVAAIKHRSFLFFVFFFSSSSSSSCSMCFKNRRQLVVLLFFFLHGNRITSAFSCSSCSSHSTYWKPKYADNIWNHDRLPSIVLFLFHSFLFSRLFVRSFFAMIDIRAAGQRSISF